MNPSAFQIGQGIGQATGKALYQAQDQFNIDNILAEAMKTEDPAMLQQSIGKILSQVSPERQGLAAQFIQGRIADIDNKKNLQKQFESANRYGYDPFAPPAVQAAQIKENAKTKRLEEFYNKTSQDGTQQSFDWNNLNRDQLISLTGSPDKEISEPAKAQLKRLDKKEGLDLKKEELQFKQDRKIEDDLLKKTNAIAERIPLRQSSLDQMSTALTSRDLGFFSLDNLAEMTGIEGLRTPEGALFKTAGKEYFLGNIARAGARPNMWVEKQILDMLSKIGRSTAANLTVTRALQNELDLDKERVRYTNEHINEPDKRLLESKINDHMMKFAEDSQIILNNDLRAIKSIDESKPQKFMKVPKGTKVSEVVAQSLLRTYNNDPEKAAAEAKKLGYEIE